MSYHEKSFEDHLKSVLSYDLHPKYTEMLGVFPENVLDLYNIILYGPSGIGKYTRILQLINKYSVSRLQYKRKMSIVFNDVQHTIKISDIHYEVDMALLGCNAKMLWHDLFQQIVEVVCSKVVPIGIIVCKNFHEIHSELLDVFYSYMQHIPSYKHKIIFMIHTDQLSFIPLSIQECCRIIPLQRPNKTAYCKLIGKKKWSGCNIENITNINMLLNDDNNLLMQPHVPICDALISQISGNNIDLMELRETIYDIFTYNLNLYECIWYIFKCLQNKINQTDQMTLLLKLPMFFQYYNNNYRPIYHVEKILLEFTLIIQKQS